MVPSYLWNMFEDGHIAIFCGDVTKCENIAFGTDSGYVIFSDIDSTKSNYLVPFEHLPFNFLYNNMNLL